MEKKAKQRNLSQLVEYKAEIKKSEKDFDKVLQILNRMSEMQVSYEDLSESQIGKTLSHLKTFKDKRIQDAAKSLIDKWKKLIKKAKTSSPSLTSSNTPTTTSTSTPKPHETNSPYSITGSSCTVMEKSCPAYRNNVRKMIYESLSENTPIDQLNKVKGISIAIELKLFEVLKEGSKYINRGKAIVANISDEKNKEFKMNILNSIITPLQLVTMDVKEMLNATQKNERAQAEKNMFESIRSDWQDEHVQVADGLHTCENCKSKKTTSKEIQMRSADEPMTLFIKCVDCGNEWKLN